MTHYENMVNFYIKCSYDNELALICTKSRTGD